MPRGKPKSNGRRANLVPAADYRAAWWGSMRDEPSDETLARVIAVTLQRVPSSTARRTSTEPGRSEETVACAQAGRP